MEKPYHITDNGLIIRAGTGRLADTGQKYAQKMSSDKAPYEGCIFCPEGPACAQDRIGSLAVAQSDGTKRHMGTVIRAGSPYETYAGYKVKNHNLLLPEDHVSDMFQLTSRADYDDLHDLLGYMGRRQRLNKSLFYITRVLTSLSRSQPHVHPHEFDFDSTKRVNEYVYSSDISRGGVTSLIFGKNEEELDLPGFYGGEPVNALERSNETDEFGSGIGTFVVQHVTKGAMTDFDGQRLIDEHIVELKDQEASFQDLSPSMQREYFAYLMEQNKDAIKSGKGHFVQDIPVSGFNEQFRSLFATLSYDIVGKMSLSRYINQHGEEKMDRDVEFVSLSDDEIGFINERNQQKMHEAGIM